MPQQPNQFAGNPVGQSFGSAAGLLPGPSCRRPQVIKD